LPALACGGDLAATLGHEPFDCHLRAVIQRYGLMSLFRNVGYGPHHQAIKPTGYDDDADAVIPEAMAQWRATYRALPEPHQIIAATIIWLIAAARTQSGCVAWPSHGRQPTQLRFSAQPMRWLTGACLLLFFPAGEVLGDAPSHPSEFRISPLGEEFFSLEPELSFVKPTMRNSQCLIQKKTNRISVGGPAPGATMCATYALNNHHRTPRRLPARLGKIPNAASPRLAA
jgi:hypothetical protein